jgi:hypothetical protein
VLAKMDSAKNGLNIVILDACRNNPFERGFRSLQAGLAQMDAPTGTFIAFATAPGSVAADGSGPNGVYTKHLLAEMPTPGQPIEQVFKQVRNGVMKETGGRQIPWESSSLRGEFVFHPGAAPTVQEAVAAALKREREAQQVEMRKMQSVLERQQKQLEALGLQTAAARPEPAAAAPETSKPVITASAAPTAVVAPPRSRLPQAGDTWTYRLNEPARVDGPKQRDYTVTVSAVTPNAILDQYAIDLEKPGEWAHSAGGYIAGLGRSLFAPYLFSFDNTRESGPVRVQIVDPACSGGYLCEGSARVTGREAVRVPAGTFDTIKVTVEHSWRPVSMSGPVGAQHYGARTLVMWYAPAAKRAVKFSSRSTFGAYGPVDTDFDLELTSYKLQ